MDRDTVTSFGDEWERFDQSPMVEDEARAVFDEYFDIFPWDCLSSKSIGFDMGCGSGRWARFVAPKVGHLNCIDPSSAIHVAEGLLSKYNNISFIRGSDSDNPLRNESQDFGYSLGVLHHVPETQSAIKECVKVLKPGAPFLIYLYYAFDNKPNYYKVIWRLSNIFRQVISRMPTQAKNIFSELIAVFVYFPLAFIAKTIERMGKNPAILPLSWYRNSSFYTMRTDSRDRFGTPLEKRFSRREIEEMMIQAGLQNILFSDHAPFWCAVGFKEIKAPNTAIS